MDQADGQLMIIIQINVSEIVECNQLEAFGNLETSFLLCMVFSSTILSIVFSAIILSLSTHTFSIV